MKKLYTTLVALFVIAQLSNAQQWLPYGTNLYFNGKVGIGTSTPSFGLLELVGNSPINPAIVALTPGVAQGELSDLSLFSTFQATGDNGSRRTADITAGFNGGPWGNEYLTINVGNNGSSNDYALPTSEKIRILSNGFVGIGTTTPHESLSVNGNIRSKRVKVEQNNWFDYVFKPTYILPSLKEVEKYIKENQHLPEIPSEKEIAKDGLDLGQINSLLTKKVEELTLYLIEKDKQLNDQEIRLKKIEEQLKALTKEK